jgi:4-nitrophenyl phosphatase
MDSLQAAHAFIIDMDGVLWEGDRPLPGLAAFFAALRARGARFVLATNNASRTPEQYQAKLAGMGVAVARDEILTSSMATAVLIRRRAPAGARVFAIGEDGLRQALVEHGCALTDLYQVNADFVVVGMDRALSWDKLATATLNIRAGAAFIGTNPDTTLPSEHGLIHGNGAILAALETATGIRPQIVGKPEPTMYALAMEQLGVDPTHTVAVGDRLGTDILGAVRAGIASVLVLTGVSTRADLASLDYGPTWVLPDIQAITAALTGAPVKTPGEAQVQRAASNAADGQDPKGLRRTSGAHDPWGLGGGTSGGERAPRVPERPE